jgi:sugar phosphate permease
MLITAALQVQWLAYAPIARAAAKFYQGQFDPNSIINIDFPAMLYMIVFLVMCIPASYVIDTYGIRVGLGIGSLIAAVSALLKGFFAESFMAVVVCQTGLALAQPFVLNAATAMTARWFPLKERGLVVGLASLAQYLGILFVMLVTPILVVTDPQRPDYGGGIDAVMMYYGIGTFIAGLTALALIKDRPERPPEIEDQVRHRFFDGLKHIFANRDMIILVFLFFVGLGIFNAISAMVDAIAGSLGVVDSDGLIGGLMLIGGIAGAVVIPALSDRYRRRKIFIVLCLGGALAGVAGLAFAADLGATPSSAYVVALAASFVLGFFIMSAGPLGFQYAAEVSFPAPESTSQGLLLLAGQITGMLFVAGMSIQNNRYLQLFMLMFVLLSVLTFVLSCFLRESPMIITEAEKAGGGGEQRKICHKDEDQLP